MQALMKRDKNGRPMYLHPETEERLIGTTKFISHMFPFTEIISPAALPWAEKSKRRELEFGELEQSSPFEEPTNDYIKQIDNALGCLFKIDATFGKMMRQASNDGNFAEEYCTAKFENREFEEIDEYGTKRERTDRGEKFGELLLEALHTLGNVEVVAPQLSLVSKDNLEVGKLDYLLRNKDTNELILLDFKTGAKIQRDKKIKLLFQLASYADMVEMEFGQYPETIIGISAEETVNNKTGEWSYQYEIVDAQSVWNPKEKKNFNLKEMNILFQEWKDILFKLDKNGIKKLRG